ncbi:triose-phosphate isomerase [Vibrio hannami]|uniref:triose-phosphate isomerase n=1 Tax=Vibrio hannami TaxID=2717094 RepID=UPI00240F655E|nr:triose-phosphate isomerase [Vibrio hannami]MDG3087881.1 triose-phosphate isomerase [Vibrio hannami]
MKTSSGKKLWIGSSWKMNKTSSEVERFCEQILPVLNDLPDQIQSFLIPPFPYAQKVAQELESVTTRIGVQNICWAESGPFTGEVSCAMAKDIGASIVEIGHSERRYWFGETDDTVNKKVRATLDSGLSPLVCVGDTADEKQWGVSVESIVRQVKIALYGIEKVELGRVLVAYEPVWAIGENGIPATPHEAEEGLKAIYDALVSVYGELDANKVTLLYGGSVHQDNAEELIQQPTIDGLFIGRAAWQPEGYAEILSIASRYTS